MNLLINFCSVAPQVRQTGAPKGRHKPSFHIILDITAVSDLVATGHSLRCEQSPHPCPAYTVILSIRSLASWTWLGRSLALSTLTHKLNSSLFPA